MKNQRTRRTRQKQEGFTLIELIIVIVIIAILAAVAIPKYLNLQTEAGNSAAAGVAGALGSASAANYALRTGLGTTFGTAVTTCQMVGNTLQGGLPTGFTLSADAVVAGSTATCTVTRTGGGSATFIAHGVS